MLKLKYEAGLVVCLLMIIICTIRSLNRRNGFCANVNTTGLLFAMYPYRNLFVELERIKMVFYTFYVPVPIQKCLNLMKN